MTNVVVQCVIERKLPRQKLLVAYPGCCEALSNGAQSNTLWRDMLLPFDICPADDQCEAVKRRVRKFIIIENGLKGTALSPVVQLHFGKPGCVEGRRFLLPSGVEELVFGYEEEHGLRVNESSNKPGTSNPIYFDVASRNPFHALFLMWFLLL